MSKDVNHIRQVVVIENLLEEHGPCNFYGLVLEALENIEQERLREDIEFEDSAHHKNLEHYQRITELTMNACDLDDRYGSAEARKINMERFKDRMKGIGVAV